MKRETVSDAKPLVSIVTVCRNCVGALRQTLASVEGQSYARREHVVVDGASTDGTAALLATRAGVRWVSEPDGGIYDAMNKGARMAQGEWVVFMNAGDTFAADDVLEQVFRQERQADVVYGDVVKNGVVKPAEPPHNGHRMYFCHQSALVRRQCLLEYPFDTSHRMSADFKQMKQLFLAGKRFEQLHMAIAVFDTTGVSNAHRSAGIYDNIRVVREVDNLADRVRLLPRLWFTWAVCRLRGK